MPNELMKTLTVGANTYDLPQKTSDLTNDSGFIAAPSANVDEVIAYNGITWVADKRMIILSYGSSTWTDFINAYNSNAVVYCRASSNANPASGSQTRLAFMAYVNNGTTPTNVEFQYYRSVSSHTASQQGDQVFVYKLDKTSGWSVTTREASVKVVAGDGLGGTYSNGTMTLTGPTKVSDLTNDSGFLTSYTETDPTVPSWAKASSKPTYTATEVGAVPKQATAGAGNSISNIINSATYITLSESTSGMGSGTLSMDLSNITLTALSNYQGTSATITLVTDPASGTAINNIILSDGTTTINGVVTPTADGMAANKKYVDDSITAAIGAAIGGSY